RAVIDDDVVAATAEAILLLAFLVARPKSHVPDDHVMRVEVHLVIFDADAIARRRLAGDGQERFAYLEFGFERDGAGQAKHDGARPFRHHRRAEAAWAAVVEIGHL